MHSISVATSQGRSSRHLGSHGLRGHGLMLVLVSYPHGVVQPGTGTLFYAAGSSLMSNRGERLRMAMDARGVRKQQAFAFQLNVHESAITRWKGNQSLSLENAVAVCAALDISLDWLLLGRGTMDFHKTPETKILQIEESRLVASFEHLSQLLSQESSSCLQSLILALLADLSGK